MTAMVLTLVLVFSILVVLTGALRRLARDDQFDRSLERLDPLSGSISAGTYRPISRLFSAEDTAFLRRFGDRGKKLTPRLGAARVRVSRLYLRQIYADFAAVSRRARMIAPYSPDPNFGFWIAKQSMIFRAVFVLVYVRSWLGWRLPVPLHVAGLVKSLETFRSGVRVIAEQADPAMRQTVLSKG